MRKRQYPRTRRAQPYAGLILSVCATIVLSGWSGCPSGEKPTIPRPPPPRPSPITVVDGSMVVRTLYATMKPVSTGEVDISGDYACSIFLNGSTVASVKGKDWTITSADRLANVSTTSPGGTASGGAIVYVTGPNPQILNSDPFNEGPGYEFGIEKVVFSPAKLTVVGVANPTSLDCGTRICRVTIDYEPSCN